MPRVAIFCDVITRKPYSVSCVETCLGRLFWKIKWCLVEGICFTSHFHSRVHLHCQVTGRWLHTTVKSGAWLSSQGISLDCMTLTGDHTIDSQCCFFFFLPHLELLTCREIIILVYDMMTIKWRLGFDLWVTIMEEASWLWPGYPRKVVSTQTDIEKKNAPWGVLGLIYRSTYVSVLRRPAVVFAHALCRSWT